MLLTFKIKTIAALLQVSMLFLCSATVATANTCDMPSSLKQVLGDHYFDIELAVDKHDNSKISLEKVHSLLSQFNSKRHAKAVGSRYLCKGGTNQRRLVNFDSELRIATSNAGASGNAAQRLNYLEKAYSADDRTSFDQKVVLELPDASQWRIVADNTIASSQLNRRRTETGFSVIAQIDTELKITAEAIQISQTHYLNGYSDNWATWTMKR